MVVIVYFAVVLRARMDVRTLGLGFGFGFGFRVRRTSVLDEAIAFGLARERLVGHVDGHDLSERRKSRTHVRLRVHKTNEGR